MPAKAIAAKAKNLFFDRKLETMPRDALQQYQQRRFRKMMEQVLKSNPFYRAKLHAAGIRRPPSPKSFTDIPFTTKAELVANQLEHPPYGSDLTFPLKAYTRMHQTSGTTGVPVRWLDTPEGWQSFLDHWGHVLRGAGVEPGDIVYVAFSFGPFIGFWGGFEAAYQMGCRAVTGGGQTTEQRLASMRNTPPTVLLCTPTYALRLAEEALALGIDTAKLGIRASIHAGEPGAGIPATRRRIEQLWGCKAYDHSGMTETGAYGYECRFQLGLHIIESGYIMEVIDPETLRPVEDGRRGELVLTNLGRVGSPLIRYRTGDLMDITRKRCACGRTFATARGGVLGRADDMITVRGINVFPSAIENILRVFPEVVEFQGEVTVQREMQELVLRVEVDSIPTDQRQPFAERVISEMHTRLNLRPVVEFAAPGTLPRAEMKSRRFQTPPRG